jgi:dolichyl-phosphate-mannose--protein O-mannosyl transferase
MVNSALLLLANYWMHFLKLSHPNEVVFDETGYGKNINAFTFAKQRRYDIHPPHASMLMGLGARFAGYDGSCSFEKIGSPYEKPHLARALRTVPALSGMLIPLAAYNLAKVFGASELWAMVAGVLLTFDNALVVQTRIIQTDGILVASTLWSLYFSVLSAAGFGSVSFSAMVAAGILSGIALGTKTTGIFSVWASLLGLVVFGWHRGPATLSELACVYFVWVVFVYLVGWMLFFDLGPGTADEKLKFSGRFFKDLIRYNCFQVSGNSKITKEHHYQSPWWAWPLGGFSIRYWKGERGRNMWCVANPIVWAVCSMLLFFALPFSFQRGFGSKDWRLVMLMTLYFTSYVPFSRVKRPLFLYHYFTPLTLSVIASVTMLSAWNLPVIVPIMWVTVTVIAFERICPFTFGLLIRPEQQFLLSRWVYEWPTQMLGLYRKNPAIDAAGSSKSPGPSSSELLSSPLLEAEAQPHQRKTTPAKLPL